MCCYFHHRFGSNLVQHIPGATQWVTLCMSVKARRESLSGYCSDTIADSSRSKRVVPSLLNKREAIAWAEEFERTLKTQGQPPTPSTFTPLTFHDALLRYQQEVTLYKARGTQLLECPQHNYLNEKLGDLPLKQITGQVVNKYITELINTFVIEAGLTAGLTRPSAALWDTT